MQPLIEWPQCLSIQTGFGAMSVQLVWGGWGDFRHFSAGEALSSIFRPLKKQHFNTWKVHFLHIVLMVNSVLSFGFKSVFSN